MRPQTRRVQAQRKFAQGAYVPPVVGSATPRPERRETTAGPSTSSDIPHDVTLNKISPTHLLDVVSFIDHHKHNQMDNNSFGHQEPNQMENDSVGQQEHNQTDNLPGNKVSKQPVVVLKRLKQGQTAPNQKVSKVKRKSRAGNIRLLSRSHSMTLRDKKPVNIIKANTKKRRHTSTDFSVDDNRPLISLCGSNAEPKAGPSGATRSAKDNIKRPVTTPNVKKINKRVKRKVKTNDVAVSSNQTDVALDSEVTALAAPKDNGQAGPIIKGNPVATTSGGYYGEVEIHRWMATSLLPVKCRPKSDPEPCPASDWSTTTNVKNASKDIFSKRCLNCVACGRIENVITLSRLLRESEVAGSRAIHRSDSAMLSDSQGQHLYIELFEPSNTELMIKVKIRKVRDKDFITACLVPRSQADTTAEFNLREHEGLVTNLIDMVTKSLAKRPESDPPPDTPPLSSSPKCARLSCLPELSKEPLPDFSTAPSANLVTSSPPIAATPVEQLEDGNGNSGLDGDIDSYLHNLPMGGRLINLKQVLSNDTDEMDDSNSSDMELVYSPGSSYSPCELQLENVPEASGAEPSEYNNIPVLDNPSKGSCEKPDVSAGHLVEYSTMTFAVNKDLSNEDKLCNDSGMHMISEVHAITNSNMNLHGLPIETSSSREIRTQSIKSPDLHNGCSKEAMVLDAPSTSNAGLISGTDWVAASRKPSPGSSSGSPSVVSDSTRPPFMVFKHEDIQPLETIVVEDDDVAIPPESSLRERILAINRAANATAPETSVHTEDLVMDAPVFRPSLQDFRDPIAFYESLLPTVAKYGLCKIVAPAGFRPKCTLNDEVRFDVNNQYISRLFNRWGPASRELCAMKACLERENVRMNRPPKIDGVEVNLSQLYHIVQRHGGLHNVLNKDKWMNVAEEMHFNKLQYAVKKLDSIYVTYILPYETLSHGERQEIMRRVEKCWHKKNQRLLDRAMNPLHQRKRILGESESSEEELEDPGAAVALAEAEDCVVTRSCKMNGNKFKRVAANALNIRLRGMTPSTAEIEEEYWRIVQLGTEHVFVNTASIDSGVEGYGFETTPGEPYSQHPWNLKMISKNTGNVLRSMGSVLGVTSPTLHLGMLFSTSCWHRDPHAMPWMEYMHSGPAKIWYGIPDKQSDNFRKAVETLCPMICQNKSMWLSSDIAMIPPMLLREHNVSLYRVEQHPGEYILVFPKAYSCSISTGYTESESVYFASKAWIADAMNVFQETRNNCEPTMFPLDKLFIDMAEDETISKEMIESIRPHVLNIIQQELFYRDEIRRLGITLHFGRSQDVNVARSTDRSWNVRDLDECEYCRRTLYLSKVVGLTGNKRALCLEHTLLLLQTPMYLNWDPSRLEGVYYVTTSRMAAVISKVSTDLERQGLLLQTESGLEAEMCIDTP